MNKQTEELWYELIAVTTSYDSPVTYSHSHYCRKESGYDGIIYNIDSKELYIINAVYCKLGVVPIFVNMDMKNKVHLYGISYALKEE